MNRKACQAVQREAAFPNFRSEESLRNKGNIVLFIMDEFILQRTI